MLGTPKKCSQIPNSFLKSTCQCMIGSTHTNNNENPCMQINHPIKTSHLSHLSHHLGTKFGVCSITYNIILPPSQKE